MPAVPRRRLAAASLALALVAALLTLLPAPGTLAVAGTAVTVADGGQDAVTARRAAPRPPEPALLAGPASPLVLSLVRRHRPVRAGRPGQRRHVDVWIPERAPPATS